MALASSIVMATVNAPYGAAVTVGQLAVKIADIESTFAFDPAAFAFLSEVSPELQMAFIDEMQVDAGKVAMVARKFSEMAGYRLALSAG